MIICAKCSKGPLRSSSYQKLVSCHITCNILSKQLQIWIKWTHTQIQKEEEEVSLTLNSWQSKIVSNFRQINLYSLTPPVFVSNLHPKKLVSKSNLLRVVANMVLFLDNIRRWWNLQIYHQTCLSMERGRRGLTLRL